MSGGWPVRMLVVSWADWPVVAAGCRPDRPAAVVAANRVLAVTPAARRDRVLPGLRRREAQGRCPELSVVPADPDRDARAWEPVVAAVETLTPGVEVWRPGALAFPTRGPSRYFGGDAALADRVLAVAERAAGQPGCRVGVADGRFAAALAAEAAGTAGTGAAVVLDPGTSPAWLSPQPVQALGPAYEELAGLLVRLGLRTLGDLAALPVPSVLGRFGPEGLEAHRLASGLDDRPLQTRTPPPDLACSAEMDPPENRVEAAAFIAKALADQLHSHLGSAGLAATTVAIEAQTEHGESVVRHWRHDGGLTASALAQRVRWQLDGWLSEGGPTGGLTSLRLVPVEVGPDRGRQLDLWGGQADSDTRAARALARVQAMLGPEAVGTAVLEGGRALAEQGRLVTWGGDRPSPPVCSRRRSGSRPTEGDPPWPGRISRPSPALVHQPVLPAEMRDGEGKPVEVSGRGLLSAAPFALAVDSGAPRPVVAWSGPWPLEERWWDGGGRRWARVQVLVEGGEAHLVYREGSRWWVEATYA